MSDYARSIDTILSPLGQALVNLSATNTHTLLSEASQLTHSRRGEASVILNRLRQLNPDIGAQFQLKDDALSEIRLRLIGSQRPVSGDFSSFIIISYCWHYPDWPLALQARPISPGWEISQPMVDAIMKLRDDPEEGVWLDKVCINQSDTRDKQVHIGAMDIIYRSARRLIILLEDIQLTKEEEDAGLTYAGFYADMCRIVRDQKFKGSEVAAFSESFFPGQEELLQDKEKTTKAIQLFIENLLGARWFSRGWCAHESRVVPHPKQNNPLFLCYGHDGQVLSFEFRCIHYIAIYLEQQFDVHATLSDKEPSLLEQRCWKIQEVMPKLHDDYSAMQHLANIATSGCLHKGDLISIALNTSSIPLVFTGQLKLVEDVIWTFSLLVLASNDLTPLVMPDTNMRLPDTTTPKKTLSWITFPKQGFYHKRLTLPLSDSITRVSRDYIEMDLLVFPSLPKKASDEAFEAASRIVEQHNLFALAQDPSENVKRNMDILKAEEDKYRIQGRAGPLKNYLPMWLAHAIDCGLAWATRFAEAVAHETKSGEWIYGTLGEATDDRLLDAAKSLYACFDPNGGHQNWGERAAHIQKLARFLTCILDARFTMLAATSPRCLSCGIDDFVFTPTISNRSWIAVPAAIAHLRPWDQRAWIVEPFYPLTDATEDPKSHLPYVKKTTTNGPEVCEVEYPVLTSDSSDQRDKPNANGTWRLRRRDCVFALKPLESQSPTLEAGKGPVLLKKQRVYGAEDYDWPAMSAAARKLKTENAKR